MSHPDSGDRTFEQLLDYLKRTRGFDFTGYKRASLTRRIDKRMQAVEVEGYDRYVEYLEANPGEFAHLFNTILINVTSFFRDDGAWDHLRDELIPRLVAGKGPGDPVRLWSAGCATGEEAYTLAMVFAEALGLERARECLKVYATDVDEEALDVARHGTYDERAVANVPPAMLERYFEHNDGRYTFRKELRRIVIFGRNDLIQDAPISRIDLLVCRNVLMYFDTETQARILSRFHFALNDDGHLFLGRAESMLSHLGTFVPVDLKRRMFVKVPRPTFRDRLLVASRATAQGGEWTEARQAERLREERLREAALDSSPVAQLVVERAGSLVAANDRARALFRLASVDVGRPLQDLELSYRPIELRSRIDQAYAERRTVVLDDVQWRAGADLRWYEVQIVPLLDDAREPMGVAVSFVDVTSTRRLQVELEHSHQELESAYEELQSTNEELETTNEELQSTVEELETTNEELQSTNEELETMNEELQATNEELQTINDELRGRSDELNEVNGFLECVFSSIRSGVVVLDRNLDVLVWNPRAEDLWGLRSDEVEGTNFLGLDIGFPVEQVKGPLRATLSGDGAREAADGFEVTLDATNRRGRPIRCRAMGTPLRSVGDGGVRGVILLMDEAGEG